MNQTEQLFTGIFAFAIGYAIAALAKNFGNLWQRIGALLFFILIPPAIIFLLLSGAMIADRNSIILSIAFAVGFIIRLVHRDE